MKNIQEIALELIDSFDVDRLSIGQDLFKLIDK